MAYAEGTSVPVERSRAEIERLVTNKGASQFMSALDGERGLAIVGWTLNGRMVRLTVVLPDQADKLFTNKRWRGRPTYGAVSPDLARKRWEQACRSRWRATLLIIKAKFEAVEAGISSYEREFLADVVMANGQTLGAFVGPQLEEMYRSGTMPKLLGPGS